MSNKVNVFVWYSQASEDSGKVLAQILGTELHGVLPPRDFTGVLVCYGATPSDKFKWEDRSVRFIFNDPRVVRKHVDRASLFAELSKGGLNTLPIHKLTPVSVFEDVCAQLGTDSVSGLSVFKVTGGDAKPAQTEVGFNQAKALGMIYASTAQYLSDKRTRVFVVDGAFVGAIAQTNDNTALFAKAAAAEQTFLPNKEQAETFIKSLLDNGVVTPAKSYWAPQTAVSPAMIQAAIKSAATLSLDFCAVDLVTNPNGSVTVLNVVSTPNITGQDMLHGPLADAVKLWLKRANRTAKEILAEIVEQATEDEADMLVAELRKVKSEASKAA